MSIPYTQYVKISSTVAGTSLIPGPTLTTRVFSNSSFLPSGDVTVVFNTLAQVAARFGTNSEEYQRAQFYFQPNPKNNQIPENLQFCYWNEDTASSPEIQGANLTSIGTSLATLQAITAGDFTLILNASSYHITGLNLSEIVTPVAVTLTSTYDTPTTTATVTATAPANLFATGDMVTITGASPSGYNGTFPIIVTSPTTFTYTFSIGSAPATPATGSITATSSTPTTFSQIAGLLQQAIRGNSGGGALWTLSTVTYNNTTNNFEFVGGVAGACTISASIGTATDILTPMGWLQGEVYPLGPVYSPGEAAETVTTLLTNSTANNNNYGSFVFTNAIASTLSVDEIVAIATWVNNPAPSPNVSYMGLAQVSSSNYAAISTALASLGGVALTLSPLDTEFPEMIPGMIMASTNYNGVNTVQNYMFQNYPGVTPSVTGVLIEDQYDYQLYNGAGINYVGQTQINGVFLPFYQTGILTGSSVPTNIPFMTAFSNEVWLKNAAAFSLLNLQLTQNQIPANPQGIAMILGTLQQDVINVAVQNGTISVGNELTSEQIGDITSWAGGNTTAWTQVQQIGYWTGCTITSDGAPPVYTAEYTLIYKKDDVINVITGQHVLI
jgi:hypothetical protein